MKSTKTRDKIGGEARVAVAEGTGRDGEWWLYLSGEIVNG